MTWFAPRPAVFLDRDDTVCRNADLPTEAWGRAKKGDLLNPDHMHLLPGARESLERLRAAGFAIVIITNQGGVARGGGTLRDVDACHNRLRELLPLNEHESSIASPVARSLIDACYSAPHHPSGTVTAFADNHPWRKPGPGMVASAARELGLDLTRSWMIGDKDRDADAAIAAGIDPDRTIRIAPETDTPDLTAATDRILGKVTPSEPIRAERVTLHATDPGFRPLADAKTRATVEAAARGIAERTGVPLLELTLTPESVTAALPVSRFAALAFLAELRRHTDNWHQRTQGVPLWSAPEH